jgi:hypothetical protein
MSLTAENYRYIQDSIAGIILQVRLKNKSVDLPDICEIISSEARNMGSVGVEYIREYLRSSQIPPQFLETPTNEIEEGREDATDKT